MKKSLLCVLFLSLFLVGCGSDSDQKTKNTQDKNDVSKQLSGDIKTSRSEADILKQKAKVAGSVSRMIGYDGDRINTDLNKIINKSEQLKSDYEDVGLD